MHIFHVYWIFSLIFIDYKMKNPIMITYFLNFMCYFYLIFANLILNLHLTFAITVLIFIYIFHIFLNFCLTVIIDHHQFEYLNFLEIQMMRYLNFYS